MAKLYCLSITFKRCVSSQNVDGPMRRELGQVGHLGYLPSSLLIGQYGRFLSLGHMGRDKYHPD